MPDDCPFCRLVANPDPTSGIPIIRMPQGREFALIDSNQPQAPVHKLLIPTWHVTRVAHMSYAGVQEMFAAAKMVSACWSSWTWTVNNDRNQTVDHVHVHLLADG